MDKGIQRIVRDALTEVVGVKVTFSRTLDVMLALRRMGVEVTHTTTIEMLGRVGGVCVYDELGKICTNCRCKRAKG